MQHPYSRICSLAMRVIAVAHTRVEGSWCAYIDAVPGNSHREEADEVLQKGDKLPEKIAKSMFPEFLGMPYAN